jgi:predicted metal-binding membrane protein
MTSVEGALRRQRALTIAALALLTLLAWTWLLLGAGMGMAPHAALHPYPAALAASMADMPGVAMPMATAAWTTAQLLLAVSMWWVMMVAMMLPAAAPVILLYARAGAAQGGARSAPGWFVAGYLAVWGLFSLVAAALQDALQRLGMLAPTTMDASAKWLAAAILIAAGLYQLSPLKETCLSRCRNPAAFLSRHYRAGPVGALRMGAVHGAFCLGCCWLLMALLFVGGVMNLAWIALLSLLVAGEKLLPGGRLLGLAAGLGFIAWGALVALL